MSIVTARSLAAALPCLTHCDSPPRGSGCLRSAPPEVDLAAAIERMGGSAAIYRELFPRLRSDATGMIAVAAGLVADGRRQEAKLMFQGLGSVASALGAAALLTAAAAAATGMDDASNEQDDKLLAEVSLALVTCSVKLENQLRAVARADGDLVRGLQAGESRRRQLRAVSRAPNSRLRLPEPATAVLA